MVANFPVIVFGAARQRVAEIMAQPVGVQFVDCAEAIVADHRLQQLVADEKFIAAVEVEIDDRPFAWVRLVEQGFQFDDRVPYRAAQVRQVDAAE